MPTISNVAECDAGTFSYDLYFHNGSKEIRVASKDNLDFISLTSDMNHISLVFNSDQNEDIKANWHKTEGGTIDVQFYIRAVFTETASGPAIATSDFPVLVYMYVDCTLAKSPLKESQKTFNDKVVSVGSRHRSTGSYKPNPFTDGNDNKYCTIELDDTYVWTQWAIYYPVASCSPNQPDPKAQTNIIEICPTNNSGSYRIKFWASTNC